MSIELRDYNSADIETLVSLANNERVSRYLIDTFPCPYTRSDAEFWISNGSKQNDAVTKVICKDGAFAGTGTRLFEMVQVLSGSGCEDCQAVCKKYLINAPG